MHYSYFQITAPTMVQNLEPPLTQQCEEVHKKIHYSLVYSILMLNACHMHCVKMRTVKSVDYSVVPHTV